MIKIPLLKPVAWYYNGVYADGRPAGRVYCADAGELGLRTPLYALTEPQVALLREAPCTCPEQESGVGMFPGHDEDDATCFRNRMAKSFGA